MSESILDRLASGETVQRLVDSVDLGRGVDALDRYMCRISALLVPELAQTSESSTWYLDPRTFATITGHQPHRLPSTIGQGALGQQRILGGRVPIEPLDDTTVWPHFDQYKSELNVERSSDVPETLVDALDEAFTALDRIDSTLGRALLSVTRLVVTFSGRQPPSFATMRAHGAIFLNWRDGDGYPFAVEEIAHQCGHVLLSTALFERSEDFFTVPPETRLRDVGMGDDEDRTVLVLFHAVFTEALMMVALHGGAEIRDRSLLEHLELEGRLLLTARRFNADLRDLWTSSTLSSSGRSTIDACIEVFDRFARPALTDLQLDLTGQPYAFCRDSFFRRNPPA